MKRRLLISVPLVRLTAGKEFIGLGSGAWNEENGWNGKPAVSTFERPAVLQSERTHRATARGTKILVPKRLISFGSGKAAHEENGSDRTARLRETIGK